jgi:hypothetical protein
MLAVLPLFLEKNVGITPVLDLHCFLPDSFRLIFHQSYIVGDTDSHKITPAYSLNSATHKIMATLWI